MNMDDFYAIKDDEELVNFVTDNCQDTSIANLRQIILNIQIRELQLTSAMTSALYFLRKKMKKEETIKFYEQYSIENYKKRRAWLIEEQKRWMKEEE